MGQESRTAKPRKESTETKLLVGIALDSLKVLSERNYQTAATVAAVLNVLQGLVDERSTQECREKHIICANALRTLRASRFRLDDLNLPRESVFEDAASLLLLRVIDDLDHLIASLLTLDLRNNQERNTFIETFADAILSVLAAEKYSSINSDRHYLPLSWKVASERKVVEEEEGLV